MSTKHPIVSITGSSGAGCQGTQAIEDGSGGFGGVVNRRGITDVYPTGLVSVGGDGTDGLFEEAHLRERLAGVGVLRGGEVGEDSIQAYQVTNSGQTREEGFQGGPGGNTLAGHARIDFEVEGMNDLLGLGSPREMFELRECPRHAREPFPNRLIGGAHGQDLVAGYAGHDEHFRGAFG